MLIARQMACLIPIKDQVNQARKSPKPLMLLGCYIYNRSLYFTRQLARATGVLVRTSQGNKLLGELRSVIDVCILINLLTLWNTYQSLNHHLPFTVLFMLPAMPSL